MLVRARDRTAEKEHSFTTSAIGGLKIDGWMRSSSRFLCTLAALIALCCAFGIPARAQVSFTKVVLDQVSFRGDVAELQRLADGVSSQVDGLIPGQGGGLKGFIFCYQVHEDELAFEKEIGAPVTISASFRYDHEPTEVVPGRIRIALFGINPLRESRFVYQLAHELAHVKMGATVSNYLIETFAIAAALEITRRMGFASYADLEIASELEHLPATEQTLYNERNYPKLRRYWQQQVPQQVLEVQNRPFQTLGAVLLENTVVPWPQFLDIALENGNCPLNNPPKNFTSCSPDLPRMIRVKSSLEALGFVL